MRKWEKRKKRKEKWGGDTEEDLLEEADRFMDTSVESFMRSAVKIHGDSNGE